MRIDAKTAADFLRENDDYLILMHASPDGDTLGCGAALSLALQRLGKHVKAVCPDDIPRKFDYLFRAVEKTEFEYRTVVCVDVADPALLGDMKAVGQTAGLVIDHHSSNVDYGERTFLEPDCAAACELVYAVIKQLGVELDGEISGCIYTGIATDTGCFKYSNVTPRSHNIAAEMIANGADFARINYVMFVEKSPGRVRLEQETLKHVRFYVGGKIAVLTEPLELLNSIPDIDSDDIGAIVNLSREISGVEIGVCVKEKKAGVFKGSIRTSENFDASEIAHQLGGGGHKRASGCTVNVGTMEEAVEAVVNACIRVVDSGK